MIDETELKRVMGDNVRRLRKAKGLTQEQLAEAAHISAVHLNRIEGGKASLSVAVAYALADALSTSADSLRQFSAAAS